MMIYRIILLFFTFNIYYMKALNRHAKLPSFNLQEMLIVLAIIGILLLIALPNLMPLISKAKSVEAQTQLKAIYNAQTTYRYMYSKYSSDISELDYEAPITVKSNGNANYEYQIIEADNASFKAKAIAVTDFDGDGIFNVWEIDASGSPKQIVKD